MPIPEVWAVSTTESDRSELILKTERADLESFGGLNALEMERSQARK